MKRVIETGTDMIPLHSDEAAQIIGKLFGKAITVFEKNKVNMPLNGEYQPKGES